jgi:hypothetical protein
MSVTHGIEPPTRIFQIIIMRLNIAKIISAYQAHPAILKSPNPRMIYKSAIIRAPYWMEENISLKRSQLKLANSVEPIRSRIPVRIFRTARMIIPRGTRAISIKSYANYNIGLDSFILSFESKFLKK